MCSLAYGYTIVAIYLGIVCWMTSKILYMIISTKLSVLPTWILYKICTKIELDICMLSDIQVFYASHLYSNYVPNVKQYYLRNNSIEIKHLHKNSLLDSISTESTNNSVDIPLKMQWLPMKNTYSLWFINLVLNLKLPTRLGTVF